MDRQETDHWHVEGFELEDAPNKSGFQIFRDGDSWVAVGPSLFDLEDSVAGFGDTPEQAYEKWFALRREKVGLLRTEPFTHFIIQE